MSSGAWTLDLDSELNVVIPWLDGEPDPDRRAALLEWLAGLLLMPDRPWLMDAENVFAVVARPLGVVVVWHLDPARRVVRVSHIGDA